MRVLREQQQVDLLLLTKNKSARVMQQVIMEANEKRRKLPPWRTQKPDGLGGPFGGGAMGGGGLGARCTWKFVAIFFMLLSVILVSALIYSTGK